MRENDFTTLIFSKIKETVHKECELCAYIANTQLNMRGNVAIACVHAFIHVYKNTNTYTDTIACTYAYTYTHAQI